MLSDLIGSRRSRWLSMTRNSAFNTSCYLFSTTVVRLRLLWYSWRKRNSRGVPLMAEHLPWLTGSLPHKRRQSRRQRQKRYVECYSHALSKYFHEDACASHYFNSVFRQKGCTISWSKIATNFQLWPAMNCRKFTLASTITMPSLLEIFLYFRFLL